MSKLLTRKELRRLAESVGATPTESCDPNSKVVLQMTLAELDKFSSALLSASKPAAPAQSGEAVASYCPSRFGKHPHAFNHQKCSYCGAVAHQSFQPVEAGEKKYDPRDPGNWRDGDDACGNASASADMQDERGALAEQAGWCYPQGGRTRFADLGDTVDASVSDKMRAVYYMEPPSEFVTEVTKIARAASTSANVAPAAPAQSGETTVCDRIVCEREGACVNDDAAAWKKCKHRTIAPQPSQPVEAGEIVSADRVNLDALTKHIELGWSDDSRVPKSVLRLIVAELRKSREPAPSAVVLDDEQAAFRTAVEEMVRMLEEGEWAEHVSTCKAPGDDLAKRLEVSITDLHNHYALQSALDSEPHGVVICDKRIPNALETFIPQRFYKNHHWGDEYSKVEVFAKPQPKLSTSTQTFRI